jgi:hypothetical protein
VAIFVPSHALLNGDGLIVNGKPGMLLGPTTYDTLQVILAVKLDGYYVKSIYKQHRAKPQRVYSHDVRGSYQVSTPCVCFKTVAQAA